MKGKLLVLVIAGVLVFGVMTAYAHHSQTGTYDASKQVKLQGKLVLMNFRNPHVFLQLDVPDKTGTAERWAIEWGGTAQLGGQGVTRDTFKTGDELIIVANPSRTPGERRAKMNTLDRPKDGFVWGRRPGEVVD